MLSCSEIKLSIVTLLVVLSVSVAFGMSIPLSYQDNFRRHLWNEAGQLSLFISNEYCGYYAYDAQGNRAYKLTGTVVADQYDAGTMQATAYFDDVTLYVNPYMVVTPRGYTKHYYNGSQRIAARLGGSWTKDSTFVQNQQWIAQAESLWETTTNTNDLDKQEILLEDVYVGGNGSALPACQYSPQIARLSGYHGDDMLSQVFSGRASERGLTDSLGIYFYHFDHLGSANWITNSQGQAVQYIHYMPYGEVWVNQQASQYDERFKFTGKERDTESGYDYFGARYYSSMLGHWLSVDKLADDYPHITPYAQSAWNPIKYKDPDGNFVGTAIDIICVGMDLYSLGKNLAEGNTQAALVDAGALAIDALAVLVPGVTAGAGIAVKAARAADKVGDGAKMADHITDAKKTYQTYTKTNLKIGEVYVGRTSGSKSPVENVKTRDRNHHKNADGFGPAVLDKSSSNPNAIRGREQMQIEKYGGAKSVGGTSGNAINGVSPHNPKADEYRKAAIKEFGSN